LQFSLALTGLLAGAIGANLVDVHLAVIARLDGGDP
jgi:hypothetical protein